MSSRELCLLSELASIDFSQFNVTVVGIVAAKGPNLASGLGFPFYSPMLSQLTAHRPPPLLLLPVILLPIRKKQGIFSVSETYTPTQ